jgi:Xaa-Pro aminopeptidase
MHEQQRQQTLDLLKSRQLDAALFSSMESIKWLTGFTPPLNTGLNPFAAGDALLWVEHGHFSLIVLDSQAEGASAFGTLAGCELITYAGYTIESPIRTHENLKAVLAGKIGVSGAARVGIEPDHLLHFVREAFPANATPVSMTGWLVPLRMIKTDEELAKLRHNFALVDEGQAVARRHCTAGTREIDVWAAVHSAISARAGAPLYLGNDCVVGYRSPNNIGGLPAANPIREDTALIVDLSTAWAGYWSDSCGTYYPQGPTPRQEKLHTFVQGALEYAISLVRPGAVSGEIDRRVRQFMADAGYPVYPHHTGHGVGVSSHEEPRIVPYNDIALQAGMVLMLEPGIYFPGETSVRLEDAVLVTSDGAEVLTHFSKGF